MPHHHDVTHPDELDSCGDFNQFNRLYTCVYAIYQSQLRQEQIMADLTTDLANLTDAVTGLTASVSALTTDVGSILAALKAAANLTPDQVTQLEAAITGIAGIRTAVDDLETTVKAAIPAPNQPTPTPTPTPTI